MALRMSDSGATSTIRRSGPHRTSRRPAVAPSAVLDATAALSSHPDALRRRLEHEQWRQRQAEERQREDLLAASGFKWYEGPQPVNMHSIGSADEYRALLATASAEGRLLVAKFFTQECWVCKTLHPKIKRLAAENPEIIWAKLNGSDPALQDLFHNLGITKVPLFHLVRGGELVSELTASLSPEKLSLLRAEVMAHKPSQ